MSRLGPEKRDVPHRSVQLPLNLVTRDHGLKRLVHARTLVAHGSEREE